MTGKIGRDIEEKKCSWLVVQVLLPRFLSTLFSLRCSCDSYAAILRYCENNDLLRRQAIAKGNEEQKALLKKHYGVDNAEDVAIVKGIFKDLDLEKVFREVTLPSLTLV